jgi:hypothetical protein
MRLCRSMVIGTALSPIVAVASCASTQNPPPATPDQDPRTVVVTQQGRSVYTNDADPGQRVRVQAAPLAVMSGLTQVYAALEIPIGTMVTTSGQVGNVNLRVPSHSVGGGQPLGAGLRAVPQDRVSRCMGFFSRARAGGWDYGPCGTGIGGQIRCDLRFRRGMIVYTGGGW